MAEASPIDGDPTCLASNGHFNVVLDWWRQCRADSGRPPTRREIDPIALKSVLSCLAIVELHDGPGRLRLRLVGTAINEMYEMGELTGRFTGRFIDQLTAADEHTAMLDTVAAVVRRQVPDCRTRTVTRPSDQCLVTGDRLLVPLTPLPGEPAMLLGVVGPLTVRKPRPTGMARSVFP